MLVEQVDRARPEPLQRCVDTSSDRLRAAVDAAAASLFQVEPELRREHHLVAHRLERLAHELLVRERPVHLRGVEEGHAPFDRGAKESDHLARLGERRVALAHPHAAEPECGHLQPASSERAFLHRSS